MNSAIWDGAFDPQSYSTEWQQLVHQYINAAKSGNWPKVFQFLGEHGSERFINSWRPGGQAWYTALHHAAYTGAPVEVVEHLVSLGAWRSLRDAKGKQPADIARQRNHIHLLPALEPIVRTEVEADTIRQIQQHFHQVIQQVITEYNVATVNRLPELDVMLEFEHPMMSFPVPAMYGGFYFGLNNSFGSWVLLMDSWSRVIEGSGLRHVVSPAGSLLIDAGFV